MSSEATGPVRKKSSHIPLTLRAELGSGERGMVPGTWDVTPPFREVVDSTRELFASGILVPAGVLLWAKIEELRVDGIRIPLNWGRISVDVANAVRCEDEETRAAWSQPLASSQLLLPTEREPKLTHTAEKISGLELDVTNGWPRSMIFRAMVLVRW
jgi:hypothetical protein